jgi:hypothetical protein
MSELNQNEKKLLIYFGWYGVCDKKCVDFDLTKPQIREKLYKVLQITDDNTSYVRYDATIDPSFDNLPNFQDFTKLECGKSYIIILKNGNESIIVDGFAHSKASSDDLGRISSDIECKSFEEVPVVTPSNTENSTSNTSNFICVSGIDSLSGNEEDKVVTFTRVSDNVNGEPAWANKNLVIYFHSNQKWVFSIDYTANVNWSTLGYSFTVISLINNLHENKPWNFTWAQSISVSRGGCGSDIEFDEYGCSYEICVTGPEIRNKSNYTGLPDVRGIYTRSNLKSSDFSLENTPSYDLPVYVKLSEQYPYFNSGAHTIFIFTTEQRWRLASAVNFQITSNELDDLHSDILVDDKSNCILNANFREGWSVVNSQLSMCDQNSEELNISGCSDVFCISGLVGDASEYNNSYFYAGLDYRGEPYWETSAGASKFIRVIKKVDDKKYSTDRWVLSSNNSRQYPSDVFAWTGKSSCPQFATWTSLISNNTINTLYISANECYQEKECSELIYDENNILEFKATGEDQFYTVPGGVTIIKVLLWGAGGSDGCHINSGGSGGFTEVVVPVEPGEKIAIGVGQTSTGTSFDSFMVPGYSPGNKSAGYGGNGRLGCAGSGGGMSAIYRGNTHISNVIAIAGGGGGGGTHVVEYTGGGAGGGIEGSNGSRRAHHTYHNKELVNAVGANDGGGGGTAFTGGIVANDYPGGYASAGSLGGGGTGGTRGDSSGGGGGAGYYGGAGGNATSNYDGAGGGGSAYINRRETISGYTQVGVDGRHDKHSTQKISPNFTYEDTPFELHNLYNKLRKDAGDGNTDGKVVIFVSKECKS